MNECVLCQSASVNRLRDFGRLPVCNRFLAGPGETETLFPLILGQCSVCALVQIIQPVPPDQLRARHPWITYTEPTGHLDALVETISTLPGVTKASVICGIFLRTDPSLERFRAQGFNHAWRLDLREDLGVADPCAGTETIQAHLDARTAGQIAARHGQPDVILIRHILEHTHDLAKVLDGLRQLVKPGGHVIFEVPDCAPALAEKDYTTLWEEHVSYFTLPTLARCLEANGWNLIRREKAGVSLIAIAQPAPSKSPSKSMTQVDPSEFILAKTFAEEFPAIKARVRSCLSEFSPARGKIALFGAGHLSCTLVNLMELKAHLHCIIDDHEKKQGLFMPGSRLPILASLALQRENIALCLSSLGRATDARLPVSNPAVRDFLARGGQFRSIFPGENYYCK